MLFWRLSCLEEHALQNCAQQEQAYFIKYIGSFVIYIYFMKTLKPQVEWIITVYCLRQENKLEGLGEERQSEWGKKQKEPRGNCTDFKSRPFPNASHFQPADAITFDFYLFFFELSQHTSICVQIIVASTQRGEQH